MVDSLATWEPMPDELGVMGGHVIRAIAIIMPLAWGLLIVFVARGRNWARIVMLVLAVAGWILVATMSIADPEVTLDASSAVLVATMVLDALALVLLFSKGGTEWFRSIRRGADPQHPHE